VLVRTAALTLARGRSPHQVNRRDNRFRHPQAAPASAASGPSSPRPSRKCSPRLIRLAAFLENARIYKPGPAL
jgi:hypothetical protein